MSLVSADDALRDHLKLPKDLGLVVTSLDANSPEAHAGIEQNDVLLKLGETPLGKPEDLDASLKKAGENPVALSLIRRGSKRVIQVQPRFRVTLGPAPPGTVERAYWIGVSVSAIEPALASQLQIRTGVVVSDCREPGSRGKSGSQGS